MMIIVPHYIFALGTHPDSGRYSQLPGQVAQENGFEYMRGVTSVDVDSIGHMKTNTLTRRRTAVGGNMTATVR